MLPEMRLQGCRESQVQRVWLSTAAVSAVGIGMSVKHEVYQKAF